MIVAGSGSAAVVLSRQKQYEQGAATGAATWRALVSAATAISYPAGKPVFTEDSPVDHIYLIDRGLVEILCTDPNGQDVTLGFRGPRQMLGLSSLFRAGRHRYSAVTLCESSLYRLSAPSLLEAMDRDPKVASLIRQTMAGDTHDAWRELVDAKIAPAYSRLVRILRMIAEVLGVHDSKGQIRLRLPCSDAALSRTISVTPEHFSRLKRKLQKDAIVTWRGQTVIICDPDALAGTQNYRHSTP